MQCYIFSLRVSFLDTVTQPLFCSPNFLRRSSALTLSWGNVFFVVPKAGLYHPTFHYYDKIPETISLEGRKVYFGSSFRGFSSWPLGSVTFGSVVALYIMVGSVWQRKPPPSWGPRSKKRGRRGSRISIFLLRACPQWPNFFALGLTSWRFLYLLTVPEAGDQAFNTWAFGKHSRSKP